MARLQARQRGASTGSTGRSSSSASPSSSSPSPDSSGPTGRSKAFWACTWCACFILIVLLLVVLVLAFVVTRPNGAYAVPGMGFREYRLAGFSSWLRDRITGR
ncbi:tetraspanin-2 [Phtheirospermum japonicum]|uniref:Tetraspanin-2 n=1 Tax=Phtheirospermum japonicum TaxID=374723 RepID=A0A830D757_9LAMI|nr:tetraspanin-2 [Phtheirospermum japonicum]